MFFDFQRPPGADLAQLDLLAAREEHLHPVVLSGLAADAGLVKPLPRLGGDIDKSTVSLTKEQLVGAVLVGDVEVDVTVVVDIGESNPYLAAA